MDAVRDLLRLIEEALLNADERIEESHLKRAKQRVAQIFQRLLRDNEDLATMAQVHLTHEVLSDERARYLMHHRCILVYNGDGWYDIHPLLDSYPPVANAIQAARVAK